MQLRPVFVSVMVYRKSCIAVRRLSMPREQRARANEMSQYYIVGGARGDVGKTFWRRCSFSVIKAVPRSARNV